MFFTIGLVVGLIGGWIIRDKLDTIMDFFDRKK